MNEFDIAVLGAGPAGLACAAACAEQGLRVVNIAPAPEAPWTPTYGAWMDELDSLEDAAVRGCIEVAWPNAQVAFGAHGSRRIDRAYARIDGDALQRLLLDRCAAVNFRRATVNAVTHDDDGATVEDDAGAFRARVVIDATGHAPRFVARPGPEPQHFQTAYGIRVEGDAPAGFVFMDFSTEHLDDDDEAPATFLYAQPLPNGQAFWEETSLAARPAVSFDVLRARLLRRLEHRGVRIGRVISEERCLLPMDAPLPALDQRTVGYGAAAAFLHPASGYALVRILSSAAPLASALVNALNGPDGARAASRAAWSALWPANRIRSRRLHQFGLYSLTRMSPERTRAFFASFFSLPATSQAAFLADSLPPGRLAALMATLFSEAPPQVRWSMVTGGAAASGSLFRALTGA